LEYQHIPVTVLPGASAFIGGDIIAGLYALDALQWQQPTLFLDLGTNGEMVLWTGKEFLATSAAAGPAFEGGNISCGVAGIYGAVNDVVIAGKKNGTTTIGGVPAVGICGSGLLAAISGMKKSGILDGNWILQQEFLDEGYPLTTPGAKSPIRITQEDVRQYLLAKSAIVSGYQILLQAGGLQETDLEEVELAGGLGMHLKVSYGIAAGLFPGTFQGKTKSVGNTSLQGAIKYLMQPGEGRHQMEEMIERLQVLSLAEQPGFEEKFIENLE
jgi:uncharacterized 2Fe-2S/4Fe-4S cluster protein (DUF4445 family)